MVWSWWGLVGCSRSLGIGIEVRGEGWGLGVAGLSCVWAG